jgi:hypothetical protein
MVRAMMSMGRRMGLLRVWPKGTERPRRELLEELGLLLGKRSSGMLPLAGMEGESWAEPEMGRSTGSQVN